MDRALGRQMAWSVGVRRISVPSTDGFMHGLGRRAKARLFVAGS